MSSSVGMMKFPIYGEKRNMFQTTKQFLFIDDCFVAFSGFLTKQARIDTHQSYVPIASKKLVLLLVVLVSVLLVVMLVAVLLVLQKGSCQ